MIGWNQVKSDVLNLYSNLQMLAYRVVVGISDDYTPWFQDNLLNIQGKGLLNSRSSTLSSSSVIMFMS